MKFLAPIAFGFAAALPVVVVFYLLKRKRVVKLISSTLLWQKFLAETQANAPFQRLRHNWLLLLQLLLLALVVFALARPYAAGQAKSSSLRVLILDASASMQATDEKPSRFEKARAEALKWVDGLRDTDRMVVLLAGANTEVKQSATSEKSALRRAVQSCEVTDAPTRLAEALKLAETLVRDQKDAQVHLFSDGAVPNFAEMENKNLPLIFHRLGIGANNLGITALDVRANPDNPAERAIFATVANFSPNAVKTELELRFDDQLLETRPLDLGPTNSQPLVFIAPQSRDGVFTVHLTATDDLAVDNQASIVSLMPQPVRVLLVTRGNRFLEKALRAAPNAQLKITAALADAAADTDVVVLDDVIPAVWPRGNVLALHTANTNWFESWSVVKTPPIVDWKNTHALLRYVNFDNVFVAESLAVKTPTWAVPLVESPQTPLILAGEFQHQRVVWVAFDVLQSSWPLRISFPIFIHNAIDWLNPASTSSSQLTLRAGDAFRIGLAQPAGTATVKRPDGSTRTLALEANSREIVFGETYKQGIYHLTAGTNEITFCVNLTDAAESNIQPRDEIKFGEYAKVTASTLQRANVEFWRWIAAAGLALLLFEWWFYHKRTA